MPVNQFLYKERESQADMMFILLDGSVIKYQGQEEVNTFEAPCILGEEALLHA